MRRRMILGIAGLAAGGALAAVLFLASGANTGIYHSGDQLLCYDCHTMHYSMQHGWSGGAVSQPNPAPGGNWLGGTGPNEYLLKAPANDLCLACHDGSATAPDVLKDNFNASPTQGRSAGALNRLGSLAPYETWKGHTLDSTDQPPGYDPTKVGFSGTVYNWTNGLECTSCHTQHGRPAAYRNLGPRRFSNNTEFFVTFVLANANDTTKDVWINQPAGYIGGSGNPATFNPIYDNANIAYNRNDQTVGSYKSSNNLGVFCAACHANFHGGPGDASVGGSGSPAQGFKRHPTAQVSIGALGGGHSSLSAFANAVTKVKVFTNDRAAWTNSSPGCLTCHKAHGNQNPFGLVFLSDNAVSVGEQGGLKAGQVDTVETGIRNLCGQCHVQGN